MRISRTLLALASVLASFPLCALSAQATKGAPKASPKEDPRLERLKAEVSREIDGMAVQTQQMVDMIFSFGELGFQEVETSKYLTGILEQHGFVVERGRTEMPEQVEDTRAGAEDAMETDERQSLVRKALSLVDERYRQVMHFVYVEGLKVDETARLLGLPEGTVKTRLMRGREALRKVLVHRNPEHFKA